jgi:probable rRNA maturation factor
MADGHAAGLRVVLVDEFGHAARATGLAAWLRGAAPARARGLVSIALVSDDAMRRMNRRYLGKNRPTDVLSFPADERGPVLGDIAIATGVARRQARLAGHSYSRELRVLALHGLLHLLGYDHEADRGRMATLEARLRRKGGLAAGVIERTGRA